MESHLDRDFLEPTKEPLGKFYKRLGKRASRMAQDGLSQITAGKPGEMALVEWEAGRLQVRQMPPDLQDILRVSLGGGIEQAHIDYCVFRGDRTRCAYLLEEAAKALREGPPPAKKNPPADEQMVAHKCFEEWKQGRSRARMYPWITFLSGWLAHKDSLCGATKQSTPLTPPAEPGFADTFRT